MNKMILSLVILSMTLGFISCSRTGNILFSTKMIKEGQEAKVKTKKSFKKNEAIYARAYLTEKIGTFNKDASKDDLIAELYIDGKLKNTYRALQNNKIAKPEYKEFIFYIYKTSYKPDFPSSNFKKLAAGEHEVKLVVKRVKYDTSSKEYETVVLAEDSFEFIK